MENKIPIVSFRCDTNRGDGNLFLFDECLEWYERSKGNGFRLWYKSIADVRVIRTGKAEVMLITKEKKQVSLFLYKVDEMLSVLYERLNAINGSNAPLEEDMLSKLERLAKLHESGDLTDEEFAKAKAKLLS